MHKEYIREIENSKNAVLMIHGIDSTPRHFDRFIPTVPEDWSVYNILLDGHGGEVQDFSRTSMKKWKAQIYSKVEELCGKYEKVVLVGHSMGTLLSINAMAEQPQVKSMMLIDVPLKPWMKFRMWICALKASFGKLNRNNPHEAALEKSIGINLTPKLWQYLGWIPRYIELLTLCRQTQKKINTINVPCYVFQSRHDELVSVKSSKYFKENPLITHEMMENSGHFYYAPEDMQKMLSCMEKMFAKVGEQE